MHIAPEVSWYGEPESWVARLVGWVRAVLS